MTGKVNISEIRCSSGHAVGVLELDNASSLNALTLTMLRTIQQQLLHWKHDENIVSVIIQSVGEKAFCSGADIRALYYALENDPAVNAISQTANPTTDDYIKRINNEQSYLAKPFLIDYFTVEYSCDYLIHNYPKPIIAWGNGLIMGGGLGLFIGASHRVVTPSALLAMPEMKIGLYPDVGATWFLNQLPAGVGLFLGLTGADVNASDALDLAMADHLIVDSDREHLIKQLKHYPWQNTAENQVATVITEMLTKIATDSERQRPPSQMIPYFPQIQAACVAPTLDIVYEQINAISGLGCWLENAKQTLMDGSPLSAHICFQQIHQYHQASLADCLLMELSLSVRCGLVGEFKEGVRARLIDKDNQPKWLYKTISEVDTHLVDSLFTPLWHKQENPLTDLL
ncbi:enoyl-CoA hydratase/isomerase family protein [Photobacterium kishitanii]|uniref:3-hydroxyisobutyryl-CoA hydrolase n=1 Tax=Photobacterium kishitanii TaxID=318456 RepID=A0A2T3KK28_9GAMM|nr:enoyl-CoA hydratase/isomerase family protein [Photobacterium kishitanii]OBU27222.1 enoyl-CoA hydratase [Photobacterium kishitanii]PSU87121.1 enoyl-CoA hydratase/isomerase family protein [Photobacterium kishitanii]PSU99860.1 enoyl-CoA hydratase/isomerase family protein [Photobacterium kishitanii]PSV19147.1 enoyl-CoA hydratase/isomerase family protein [Photobacterium kishitanii]PSW68172.1 enoyl-CoA hydratase/isomerase family protein [Photobacterium kishitanii]